MASTYSTLKLQLMTTGENLATWGNVTNVNLGTAVEEMVTGSADVTFASGTVTLTLTDTNASQTARNLRLNLTGTSGGAQNLIVPAVEKVYIVNNGCADAITVKNSTGTGIAIPTGKTLWVYNDGTNVVDVVTHLTSLTLGSALPVASGGTGSTTAATARTALGITANPITAAFYVYRSANVTNFSGDNTLVQYPLNTESSDLGACYNTASYQFTAPAAGTLEGGFQVCDTDTTGDWLWQRILVRGSVFGDVYIENGITPTAGFSTASFTRPYKVKVASGETVQMWCRNRSAALTKTSTLGSGINTGVMWWGSFVPD